MSFYTVKEIWEEVLNKKISLPTLYILIREKRIPSLRIGGRIFVRKEVFHAWIEKQEEVYSDGNHRNVKKNSKNK